jgi:hypothetical protein
MVAQQVRTEALDNPQSAADDRSPKPAVGMPERSPFKNHNGALNIQSAVCYRQEGPFPNRFGLGRPFQESEIQCLLLGGDCVLRGLSQIELCGGFGFNLDGFAGLRITSHARFAMHLL